MRRSYAVLGVLLVLPVSAVAQGPRRAAPPRVLTFVDTLKGTDDLQLRWPVAVAAASAEEVAVADAFGSRLLRFRKVGVSWQLDTSVALAGVPVGLVWDGARYVVSHRGRQGLVAYEGEELLQRRLPLPRGVVPGALATYSGGDLLVFDYAGHRAVRLSGGSEASSIPLTGEVAALATSAAGGFFAAVPASGAVLHIDAAGTLAASWAIPEHEGVPGWPVGLAVEPGGDLVVVDRHSGRLIVLDAAGDVIGIGSRQGWEPGLLLQPRGIARLPDGLLVVADEGNGRAQLFRRSD